jgi:hypothetical protein
LFERSKDLGLREIAQQPIGHNDGSFFCALHVQLSQLFDGAEPRKRQEISWYLPRRVVATWAQIDPKRIRGDCSHAR